MNSGNEGDKDADRAEKLYNEYFKLEKQYNSVKADTKHDTASSGDKGVPCSNSAANSKVGAFDKWRIDFAVKNSAFLFEILLLADKNKNDELKHLICHVVAQFASSKSPIEMRKILKLDKGYSESEENIVERQMMWCDEF